MKQKLSVRVIIRQNNKILLARRLSGRESLRGFFELPGGEVAFGETPEISLQGQLQKNLNVNVQTLQLNGVYSEIDKENTSMQHVAIAYLASLINGPTLEPSHKYDKYVWRKMSEIQLNNLTSMSASILRLGETTQINSSDQNTYTNNDVEKHHLKSL